MDVDETDGYPIAGRRLNLQPASRHPEMRYEFVRVETFKPWPKQVCTDPLDLAKAGFFYTGSGDCVACYDCGGVCKEWRKEDIPNEEHAKHFPECSLTAEYKARKDKEELVKNSLTNPIDPRLCYDCQNARISIIVLPCEHVALCTECSKTATKCPVCHGIITEKITIYF